MKVRVRYSKRGKVRFTGHRDTARHWERALRKAGLPVELSVGFSPRPKLSFGLALPTGAESVAEYLDIDLVDDVAHPLSPSAVGERLGSELPAGYAVDAVVERTPGTPSLQQDVVACTWEVSLAGITSGQARDAARRVIEAGHLPLERERKGERTVDDLRPGIEAVEAVEADDIGPRLRAVLTSRGRAVRPVELVAVALPGVDAVETAVRVLRTHQWIERDGKRDDVLPTHGKGF